MLLALLASLLAAAPAPVAAPTPRDLRVVLDCRWTEPEQCTWTKKALDAALVQEKVCVADRVERLEPLKNALCIDGCPPVADGDGAALPTLFVVPAHFVDDAVHLAFTAADGTVRSVLYLDADAFDRYRRQAPLSQDTVVDLIKVTTGLWLVDAATGLSRGGTFDDGITWEVKERVWRSALRSLVRHGFSQQAAQLGPRTRRDSRWEVRLQSVRVTPEAPLWTAVAEAAIGRRLEYLLDEYEQLPASLGAHSFTVEFVNAAYGTGTRGFSKLVEGPQALHGQSLGFMLCGAVDGAHLMPRSFDLAVKATLQLTPRKAPPPTRSSPRKK
ncbi:MAG: hypothetical protein QM765_35720 [Myxococcales bacterium]